MIWVPCSRHLSLQAKEGKETEKYESYIVKFVNDTDEAVKELDDLINNRIKQK